MYLGPSSTQSTHARTPSPSSYSAKEYPGTPRTPGGGRLKTFVDRDEDIKLRNSRDDWEASVKDSETLYNLAEIARREGGGRGTLAPAQRLVSIGDRPWNRRARVQLRSSGRRFSSRCSTGPEVRITVVRMRVLLRRRAWPCLPSASFLVRRRRALQRAGAAAHAAGWHRRRCVAGAGRARRSAAGRVGDVATA
jgi:hypothetical protein